MAIGIPQQQGCAHSFLIPGLYIKPHLHNFFFQQFLTQLCQWGCSIAIHLTARPQSYAGQRFTGSQPSPGSPHQIWSKQLRNLPQLQDVWGKTGIQKGSHRVPATARNLILPISFFFFFYYFISVQQNHQPRDGFAGIFRIMSDATSQSST